VFGYSRLSRDFACPSAEALKYKNNIFLLLKRLSCTKNGGGSVHFLIEHFTFLGFEIQNWMLIVVGVIAVFILFIWKARDRF
jgi:disulfide bond formation protein DsbB